MSALSPSITAELADDVYMLTRLPTLEAAYSELNSKYGDVFSFSNDNMLKGRTGGPGIIKCNTAFGFTLIGKNAFEGHVFLLFRGTQYLADWLTNLNATVSRSASGQPVHDGFNKAFLSMRQKVQEFMDAVPSSKKVHVHCIGHSLGGAVATLCADWVVTSYRKSPYLYTYGSPRVGLVGFSDCCTKVIGNQNIFRAYHKSDVVPMVPTWPYIHTPNRGQDYFLPSPGVISIEQHYMENYIKSVEGKSWSALGRLQSETVSESQIMRWLKSTTSLSMTFTSIEWLSHALIYVLKKCVSGAEWLISEAFTNGFTLMDKLAYILEKGIKLAETVSEWVVFLMRRIMKLLGYGKVVELVDLTRNFIHSILMQLQMRLNQYAKDALSKVLVKGRAI